mmetsp:Transcript_15475/g.25311  ORF Transcript_15475/g.25311 Transcript_15475/m.25311 type:complete len:320 (-) Transcript_15475:1235-2194(-)|eukprot:CAMPEP_0203760978 /NCGR_PEP_ID=MMETSP0098-20131031/14158_1 /ASSEMBLY_ACC=CAM_ASM_000208 /TAXON_ID=96639 /ORGANISM=" , Strain NY0313808BC1" /LENGTH=319 /DNA_ID=CAMNT_0050654771 /DNA_START=537 /DNA_END=1496 /DNA_ORIENTATION=-
MRKTFAAAERARLREKARLESQAGLDLGKFESAKDQGDGLENGISTGARNEEGEEKYASENDLLSREKDDRSSVPLSAFNLEEERETGHFDENGGYVWRRRDRAEEEELEDPWVGTISKDNVVDENVVERLKQARDKTTSVAKQSKEFYMDKIVQLLEADETVVGGLQRFGKEKDKSNLDKLTAAAHSIVEEFPEVYETKKERMERELAAKRRLIMSQTYWEYRLSADNSGDVHGPFDSNSMQAWRDQGYFSGNKTMYVRKADKPEGLEPEMKKRKVHFEKKTSTAENFAADFDDESEEEVEDVTWIPVGDVNFQFSFQ